MRKILWVLIAVAMNLLAIPALAGSPAPKERWATHPIQGWLDYCNRSPLDCSINLAEPATIHLDRETKRLLRRVNRQVNHDIVAVTDKDHWGVVDRWELPSDGMGDCEDYQLLKRQKLVQAGLPHRALLMTVVTDETGSGHALLTVRTDQGDFLLDNLTDDMKRWDQTSYLFVSRENQNGPGWVSLGGVLGTTLSASTDSKQE
jgi:predicted transglutaminase-like cysteine proteinase